jgi:hypothetical protein
LEDTAGIHDALPPALKAHVRPRFKKPRVELPLAEARHPAPGKEAMTATASLLPGYSCVSAGYVRMAYQTLAYSVFYLLVREGRQHLGYYFDHLGYYFDVTSRNHLFVFIA